MRHRGRHSCAESVLDIALTGKDNKDGERFVADEESEQQPGDVACQWPDRALSGVIADLQAPVSICGNSVVRAAWDMALSRGAKARLSDCAAN
jgi:hypothetical protein